MDEIELVSIDEALSAKRKMKKSKVVEKIEATLKKLPTGQSGKIVAKTEKPQTVKNRIVRVAKSLGMENVTVKRVGDVVYFFKEPEK
jgi:hypothetical protein